MREGGREVEEVREGEREVEGVREGGEGVREGGREGVGQGLVGEVR